MFESIRGRNRLGWRAAAAAAAGSIELSGEMMDRFKRICCRVDMHSVRVSPSHFPQSVRRVLTLLSSEGHEE